MTVTLKRRRGAVSYKEPSSEEDVSEGSSAQRAAKNKRVLPTRRSTRRSEIAEDQDDEDSMPLSSPEALSPREPPRASQPSRSSRSRGRHRISYKDISSDEDEDSDADFELEVEPIQAMPTTRRRKAAPLPHTQADVGAREKPRRMVMLGKSLASNNHMAIEHKSIDIASDGIIPAWATLPYHVLLQVFVYASHPLRDENMKPTTSIPWLVKMACVCSAFTKPALTALYRNPPIFATKQTRKALVRRLITPSFGAHQDYQVMVKRLELDATQMTGLTDATHSVEDLAALIRSLTTVREVDVFDPIDRPPFRERMRPLRRWVYPNEMFEALRQSDLRLRSWRWNRAFCKHDFLWMKTIHSDSAFQSLRELILNKFHPQPRKRNVALEEEEEEEGQDRPLAEELFASALAVLPHLRSLSFETCGIVSGRLLPLLPDKLISLNITNCGELLSDALQAFLATHGTRLEELTLHHNQALDLSFLVELKQYCPRLEVLRVDTAYYSSLAMSSDNEPLYQTLLGETEVPTWPSTLRIIDMQYLRNWNSKSATNLFKSLIDAAKELPWLRELTIVAMVDTDWRQRAHFRMKWSAMFKKVFARKWESPSAHLMSLKAFRLWVEQREGTGKEDAPNGDGTRDGADQASGLENMEEEENDNDARYLSSRHHKSSEQWDTRRLRSRSKAAGGYDELSDEKSDAEGEIESEVDDGSLVQGLCHTVIFRLDNFRPREEIYGEMDFLDSEPSGDEEWNGNDENDDEGYAW